MAQHDLREWAHKQFDKQKNTSAKEKGVVAEREAAARATRAKTERLKALRLAKEAADKLPAPAEVPAVAPVDAPVVDSHDEEKV